MHQIRASTRFGYRSPCYGWTPAALLEIRQTGVCTFHVPEALFDLSYPGQYRRHVKSVRLTIPCVTGPYTAVSATLTLDNSYVRNRPDVSTRTQVPHTRASSIATCTAQSDAGVFELNFHDDRYLPFEGAGVDSEWTLELPKRLRSFDYETISDVILEIAYTARYDATLREEMESAAGVLEGLYFQGN